MKTIITILLVTICTSIIGECIVTFCIPFHQVIGACILTILLIVIIAMIFDVIDTYKQNRK